MTHREEHGAAVRAARRAVEGLLALGHDMDRLETERAWAVRPATGEVVAARPGLRSPAWHQRVADNEAARVQAQAVVDHLVAALRRLDGCGCPVDRGQGA